MKHNFRSNRLLNAILLVVAFTISAGWVIGSGKMKKAGPASKHFSMNWVMSGSDAVNKNDSIMYEAWDTEDPYDPPIYIVTGGQILIQGEWKVFVKWTTPGVGNISAYSADSTLLISKNVTVTGSPVE